MKAQLKPLGCKPLSTLGDHGPATTEPVVDADTSVTLQRERALALVLQGQPQEACALLSSRSAWSHELLAAAMLAGHRAWHDAASALIAQLQQHRDYHMAAAYCMALHDPIRTAHMYRDAGLLRDALAVAAAHLLPADPLLQQLRCEYAHQALAARHHEVSCSNYLLAGQPGNAAAALAARGSFHAMLAAAQIALRAAAHTNTKVKDRDLAAGASLLYQGIQYCTQAAALACAPEQLGAVLGALAAPLAAADSRAAAICCVVLMAQRLCDTAPETQESRSMESNLDSGPMQTAEASQRGPHAAQDAQHAVSIRAGTAEALLQGCCQDANSGHVAQHISALLARCWREAEPQQQQQQQQQRQQGASSNPFYHSTAAQAAVREFIAAVHGAEAPVWPGLAPAAHLVLGWLLLEEGDEDAARRAWGAAMTSLPTAGNAAQTGREPATATFAGVQPAKTMQASAPTFASGSTPSSPSKRQYSLATMLQLGQGCSAWPRGLFLDPQLRQKRHKVQKAAKGAALHTEREGGGSGRMEVPPAQAAAASLPSSQPLPVSQAQSPSSQTPVTAQLAGEQSTCLDEPHAAAVAPDVEGGPASDNQARCTYSRDQLLWLRPTASHDGGPPCLPAADQARLPEEVARHTMVIIS